MKTVFLEIGSRQIMGKYVPILSLFNLLNNKIIHLDNLFVQSRFVMKRRNSGHDNYCVPSFAWYIVNDLSYFLFALSKGLRVYVVCTGSKYRDVTWRDTFDLSVDLSCSSAGIHIPRSITVFAMHERRHSTDNRTAYNRDFFPFSQFRLKVVPYRVKDIWTILF